MHKLLSKQTGQKMLMLGNEAIARGAVEAGLAFGATYPGTPSSEISANLFAISRESDLCFEYCTNEKVALEVAAGWANHLTGTFDAYLRHTLKTRWPRVIGVAIEDTDEKLGWWQRMTHTMAACLSIIGVPGTQVICASDRTDDPCLVGEAGFLEACELAAGLYLCADNLPPLPTPKSPDFMDRHAVLAWLSD